LDLLTIDAEKHEVGPIPVHGVRDGLHLIPARAVDEPDLVERVPECRLAVLAPLKRLVPFGGLGDVEDRLRGGECDSPIGALRF
jgi:hypothetical protein